ncbi:MAG TPA: hypothetical protein VJO16_14235 [Candidatus Acidoferrum sp.]|nr:hypothetical protein [Candidatus Acidoferrum sp.]
MSIRVSTEDTAADRVRAARAERLESWKEITVYFHRSVRCVQRWDASESLPVHRHVHAVRRTVFAFRSELEVWSRARVIATAVQKAGTEPPIGNSALV